MPSSYNEDSKSAYDYSRVRIRGWGSYTLIFHLVSSWRRRVPLFPFPVLVKRALDSFCENLAEGWGRGLAENRVHYVHLLGRCEGT